MEKQTATHADSLAYNMPTFLKEKIAEFYMAIWNDNIMGFHINVMIMWAGVMDGVGQTYIDDW